MFKEVDVKNIMSILVFITCEKDFVTMLID